jgi:hypothetical protein
MLTGKGDDGPAGKTGGVQAMKDKKRRARKETLYEAPGILWERMPTEDPHVWTHRLTFDNRRLFFVTDHEGRSYREIRGDEPRCRVVENDFPVTPVIVRPGGGSVRTRKVGAKLGAR